MKLIDTLTGDEVYAPGMKGSIDGRYIRAELPEHWRVEGYDKSWEWLEKEPYASGTKWEWVSNRTVWTKEDSIDGFRTSNPEGMNLPEISRAEFEYHIYNPWKKVQDGMNELERGIEKSKLNQQPDMSDIDKIRENDEETILGFTYKGEAFTAKAKRCESGDWVGHVKEVKGAMSQAQTIEDLIDNLKKAIYSIRIYDPLTKATGITSEDYRKLELEDLKVEAEKLGYELVRKESYVFSDDQNSYHLYSNGLNVYNHNIGEHVFVSEGAIETLIEKYNQFKSNP